MSVPVRVRACFRRYLELCARVRAWVDSWVGVRVYACVLMMCHVMQA